MIAGRLRWREPGQKTGIGPEAASSAAFEFEHGTLLLHRGRLEEARVAARWCAATAALARARSRRPRAARGHARRVSRGADAREPHAQARADRSAPLQRHRQRLLGRDPARGAAVAAQADALADRRGDRRGCYEATRATLTLWIERLRARGRRRLPREGDRVSRRDGRPWPVQAALPRLRRAGAADRLRRQRVQLLRAVPDRRPAAGRPLAVAAAEGRLAAIPR